MARAAKKLAIHAAVEVEAKLQPSQRRSRATYERILDVAAALLDEVGMEHLSTNLVAKRAEISPAALYRYFPNKYALIVAIAEILSKQTDDVGTEWLQAGGLDTHGVDEAAMKNFEVLKRVTETYRNFPGGVWIARSMRALPPLREMANRTRDHVVEQLFAVQKLRYPHIPEADLRAAIRLSTELLNAATLMVIEDPDLDEDKTLYEASRMVALYYDQFDRSAVG